MVATQEIFNPQKEEELIRYSGSDDNAIETLFTRCQKGKGIDQYTDTW